MGIMKRLAIGRFKLHSVWETTDSCCLFILSLARRIREEAAFDYTEVAPDKRNEVTSGSMQHYILQ